MENTKTITTTQEQDFEGMLMEILELVPKEKVGQAIAQILSFAEGFANALAVAGQVA